jgi:spore germination protein KC
VREIFDFFARDPEMRRRIKVFITPGQARDLLEFKPPSGETGGRFFAGIIANHKKNTHVGGTRTDLGFISQAMDNEGDPIVPRLELADGIVKGGGLAIFRKDQFAGYLDEYTLQGLKLISGTSKSAAITATCPDHPWSNLVFELFIHETRLRPQVNGNGEIYFTLDISMWGTAGEVMCARYHDVNKPSFLRQMEQLVAQEVKLNTLHTMQVLQQKGVDSANLRGKLKAYQPKEWKKIKERWEEVYPTISLQPSVNVVIRGVGEHR